MASIRRVFDSIGRASLLGFIIVLLSPMLFQFFQSGRDVYPDFIGGNVAFSLENKTGEIYFVFFVCLAYFLGLVGLSFFSSPKFKVVEKLWNGLEGLEEWGRKYWLFLTYKGFLSLLLFLVISFFAGVSLISLTQVNQLAWISFFGLSVGMIFVLASQRFNLSEMESSNGYVLFLLAQIPLPFLLLRFSELSWQQGETIISIGMNPVSRALVYGVILSLVSWNVWKIGWFLGRGSSANSRPVLLSRVSLFCIVAFLMWQSVPASPFMLDDYHTGEMLLPYHQIYELGLTNFKDFVSVHAYLATVQGFINDFIFEGTYASFPLALNFLKALLAGMIALLVASVFQNPYIGLFLGIWALPQWERYFLLPILLLLLIHPKLFSRPLLHLIVVFSASLLALLFNPSSGMALFIAIAPWILLRFWKFSWKERGIFLLITGILIGAFHKELVAVLGFVRENGLGAIIGFSMSLMHEHEAPAIVQRLGSADINTWAGAFFKWLKLWGWVFALGVLLSYYLIQVLGNRNHGFWERFRQVFIKWRDQPNCLVVFSVLLFLGAMIPYAYSWVGTRGLGRTGPLSVLAIGFIIPILIFKWDWRKFGTLTLVLLLFGLGLRFLSHVRNFQMPTKMALRTVAVPANLVQRDSAELPNMGAQFVSPVIDRELDSFQELYTVSKVFRDRGYLDLTNRQNFYFLFNLKVPAVYPAHIVAHNYLIQDRMLERLAITKPLFVRLARKEDHIRGTAVERSYRIVRYLFENSQWILMRKGPTMFLVERNHGNLIRDSLVGRGWEFKEEFADDLHLIWPVRDLGLAPANWAASWENIQRELGQRISVDSLQRENSDYVLLQSRGKRSGEFRIDYKLRSNSTGDLHIVTQGFRAIQPSDRFILPLRLTPEVLTGEYKLDSFEIHFLGNPNQGAWKENDLLQIRSFHYITI